MQAERRSNPEIIEHLREAALFHNLPEATLNHFAEKAQQRKAEKGKVLFIQGDEAEWCYFLISGWVKLFRETLEGAEAVIDVIDGGHLFGEGAFLGDHSYHYSAQTVEAVSYLSIPISLIRYHTEKNPQMAMNMLNNMARQRKQQSREIEHLNVQNAPQRIGCFLLRLCPEEVQGAAQLHLPYDKTLIAARLGMKPETFSRALSKLRTDTNLTIRGSSVTVPSIEALVAYTCNHCSNSFPCNDRKQA